MKITILDGYVDEPSCLGVPPYISPYPRAASGAAFSEEAEVSLITIDEIRLGRKIPDADLFIAIAGTAVPGKYLRGSPASRREIIDIASKIKSPKMLAGPMAAYFADDYLRMAFDFVVSKDVEASVYEFVRTGRFIDRRRSLDEYDHWSILGAEICRQHPDIRGPLIAELQTYRGCIRYRSGGCSFCIEPGFGEVQFRNPDSVISEARALSKAGVKNIRVGGQSCLISYMAEGVGESETPRPSPGMIDYLLRGIRDAANPKILHLDNANPAVMAEHPDESRRIMQSIVRYCTSGNVLAFGLESADPVVAEQNNLNATTDQTTKAIELMNEVGAAIGPTGLPMLLPGLNFLCGLRGESKKTFDINRQFLLDVMRKKLLLRRINIRQVISSRESFPGTAVHRSNFINFKEWVRREIDRPMLEKIVPAGAILRDVYLELNEGNITFGRQVGTYPLLVGLPYKCGLDRFIDVMVTSHGYRSISAVEYPLAVNKVPMAALSSLPMIGEKRARRIVLARPIVNLTNLRKALDSDEAADIVARYANLDVKERMH
ncbi:MAG: radical SAM protein [Thermoplasmata archaeon]|nr:radical SAM protein [Thermoplasmata archaeon]